MILSFFHSYSPLHPLKLDLFRVDDERFFLENFVPKANRTIFVEKGGTYVAYRSEQVKVYRSFGY